MPEHLTATDVRKSFEQYKPSLRQQLLGEKFQLHVQLWIVDRLLEIIKERE